MIGNVNVPRRPLHDATLLKRDKPLLSKLEEVIGLLGALRANDSHGYNERPLVAVNRRYGRGFQQVSDAIAFMEEKVEEAKQEARDRAARFRKEAAA